MTAADLDLATDVAPWWVVNDGVMGGVSSSRIEADDSGVRFGGVVRTEYNGGFASARRALAADALPADAAAFALRVRGDGHRYRLVVYTRDARGRPHAFSYFAEFQTETGRETAHRLSLADFRAGFRGRPVPEAPPLAMPDVIGVGLMLLKDGHRDGRGPFDLQLLSLRAAPSTR